MNEYKILVVSNGIVQTIYVTSSDPSAAAYCAGVNIQEIVKIELIGSQNKFDFRTPAQDV